MPWRRVSPGLLSHRVREFWFAPLQIQNLNSSPNGLRYYLTNKAQRQECIKENAKFFISNEKYNCPTSQVLSQPNQRNLPLPIKETPSRAFLCEPKLMLNMCLGGSWLPGRGEKWTQGSRYNGNGLSYFQTPGLGFEPPQGVRYSPKLVKRYSEVL